VRDVSVVHSGAARYRRAAAATPRTAAAQRDTEKRAQHREDDWGAFPFTPLSVETFGRLGTPMMRLLSDIGNLAVLRGDGLFPKEQFISGVLPKLSVTFARPMLALSTALAAFL
jgi:hypothetical protein